MTLSKDTKYLFQQILALEAEERKEQEAYQKLSQSISVRALKLKDLRGKLLDGIKSDGKSPRLFVIEGKRYIVHTERRVIEQLISQVEEES